MVVYVEPEPQQAEEEQEDDSHEQEAPAYLSLPTLLTIARRLLR